tara:strand:- start:143 stop:328 length:186 start_codon:yes stop_codon:yes gene_type:complete
LFVDQFISTNTMLQYEKTPSNKLQVFLHQFICQEQVKMVFTNKPHFTKQEMLTVLRQRVML